MLESIAISFSEKYLSWDNYTSGHINTTLLDLNYDVAKFVSGKWERLEIRNIFALDYTCM